tara:strand:+ start:149 stop:649 length:501 start_codon:yes stop_codon:yes gene_type:complete
MLFHGTSLKRAKRILTEGFKGGINKNWTCSKDEVCFYDDSNTLPYGHSGENAAYWNGIPALLNDEDTRIVVFMINKRSNKRDKSCPGNPTRSARVFTTLSKNSIIKAWISPDLSDHWEDLVREVEKNELSTVALETGNYYSDSCFRQDKLPLEQIPLPQIKKFVGR